MTANQDTSPRAVVERFLAANDTLDIDPYRNSYLSLVTRAARQDRALDRVLRPRPTRASRGALARAAAAVLGRPAVAPSIGIERRRAPMPRGAGVRARWTA